MNDIDCISFNELMKNIINKPIEQINSYFDELMDKTYKKYDVIVVDEAQDFSMDEALAIRQMLRDDKDSVLYIFLDENQNLFNVDFESAFAIDSPPYILRYNIRNTGEIYRYATDTTGLGSDTKANNLFGVTPEVRKTKNRVQTVSTVSSIINRLVQKECVNTNSIVILSDLVYNESALSNETQLGPYIINSGERKNKSNEILFRTVSEYKGLESDVVIYIISPRHMEIDDRARKQEDYVAITRARYYLYIIEQK